MVAMKPHHHLPPCALAAMLTLAQAGCGGDAPVDVPDRPAFDQAIQDYLKQKSMDLKIDQYRAFELGADGQTAAAEVTLGLAAEAGANVKTRFRFNFHKSSGRWQVLNHEKVN